MDFRSLIMSRKAPPSDSLRSRPRSATAYGELFGGVNWGSLFFKSAPVDFRSLVQKGYKENVWVYRCLTLLSDAVGSIPWEVYIGDTRVNRDDPFQRLVDRPNPYQDRKEFFFASMLYLELSGNDFWEIVTATDVKKKSKLPSALYHLRPDWCRAKVTGDGFVGGYVLDPRNGVTKIEYELSEIYHMMYLDPVNPFYGMSPLQALAGSLETDQAIANWNRAILSNYAMPAGILSVPANIVPDDRSKLESEISTQFSGDNLSKPMILWGGMSWQQVSLGHNELQFSEQRQNSKEEICAAIGVPANLVGATDPKYSNYETARLSFWEDRIIPTLEWYESKINQCIAPRFGDNYRVKFNISGVAAFRGLFEKKVESASKLFSMGWPMNAINERLDLGFKPVEWGNVGWLPMALQPIRDGNPMELPEAPNGDPNAGDGGELLTEDVINDPNKVAA